MSHVIDRLVELRRHLEHLRELRPQITGPADLRSNLSLHNDVLFSLLMVCQLVIDLASELSARKGLRFADYTEAVQNLASYPEFPRTIARDLEKLPGFRNVVIHEYVTLDYARVIEALDHLDPVEQFLETVRQIEAAS